ncbi:MAG: hypothetical protein JXR36_00685 [Bacteroidales bacterium]|nr:hypothetical protein [Bacteroidales bacterium]
MKNLSFLIILSITFINSCNNVDNEVQGVWVIDTYQGQFQLLTNGICFEEDHRCTLPMVNINERHTDKEVGSWKTFYKDGKYYLEITTNNSNFNDTYEIVNLKKIKDAETGGFIMKMTLVSDCSTLYCTKALL